MDDRYTYGPSASYYGALISVSAWTTLHDDPCSRKATFSAELKVDCCINFDETFTVTMTAASEADGLSAVRRSTVH